VPSAYVKVENNFKRLKSQYESAEKRALRKAAGVVATAAVNAPSRYKIGSIKHSIRATPVHKVRNGWRLIVWATDWRAGFFEFGTYQHRRKALKRPRSAAGAHRLELGNKGVTAQHFMSRAGRAGRVALLTALQRELGGR
jgi:HK97 gp10 family phage protein